MLKHIKPKDLIEFFLFGFVFVAIIVISGFLEAAPLSLGLLIAAAIGLILWVLWFALVARDRRREAKAPVLWMSNGKTWVAQDGSGRIQPFTRRVQPIFDQDDHINKEDEE